MELAVIADTIVGLMLKIRSAFLTFVKKMKHSIKMGFALVNQKLMLRA